MVWTAAQQRLDHVGHEFGGETALRVMESLQLRLIEDRPEHCWPVCPRHRLHPLWIEPVDPDARWICPSDGRKVARLGELSSL
jgi:hypothetical protein